jgi:transposase InsO family protein
MHHEKCSLRRLAAALDHPVSTLGRWLGPGRAGRPKTRPRPVSDDAELRDKIRQLSAEDRQQKYGHRRIRAMLRRRFGLRVNRKTVAQIMREEGLSQPKLRFKSSRPKRVEKMRPAAPNCGWQIDMTSFVLSDLSPLFLMIVIDCFSRKVVGWTLDRRCRAGEWVSALRLALETQGLATKEQTARLTVRSDNGAQPCSKCFVEYLAQTGVRGQYTGYNAPDDNAFVERVIRTIKEEEIWPNLYDTWAEAHAAVDHYVRWYNAERIHSALAYRTPNEVEAAYLTLKAA